MQQTKKKKRAEGKEAEIPGRESCYLQNVFFALSCLFNRGRRRLLTEESAWWHSCGCWRQEGFWPFAVESQWTHWTCVVFCKNVWLWLSKQCPFFPPPFFLNLMRGFVYVVVDRLALAAAAWCCRLLFQRVLKRCWGNVCGVSDELMEGSWPGLESFGFSQRSHPKNEEDIAFACATFMHSKCVGEHFWIGSRNLVFCFVFLPFKDSAVWRETSSRNNILPPHHETRQSPWADILIAKLHIYTKTFGLVWFASDRLSACGLKVTLPLSGSARNFFLFSLSFSLSLARALSLSLDCSSVSAFVARAGQDGGHFDKCPETVTKFRLSLSWRAATVLNHIRYLAE